MPARDLFRYGAVCTKIRAVWGKRLTEDDYSRLSSMKNIAEVAAFLQSHPFWSGAFTHVTGLNISRYALERALRRYMLEQNLKLFAFLRGDDENLLRFPVIAAEIEQIMTFMRCAAQNRQDDYHFNLSPYFAKHSKIRYDDLSNAITYDDMLVSVRDTFFWKPLVAIRPEGGGFPPYLEVERVMNNYYYAYLSGAFSDRRDDNMLDVVRVKIDLENIVNALRVKTSYPSMNARLPALFIPGGKSLGKRALQSIADAQSAEDIIKSLSGTRYASHFTQGVLPEQASGEIVCSMLRRAVRGKVGAMTVIAYSLLSDLELKNLVHIIECVRYGIPTSEALSYLVGLRSHAKPSEEEANAA